MDRFKFRVWDKVSKTYNYKHPYNNKGRFFIMENGKLFSDFGCVATPEIRQDDFIIEQCTGLKDKNGKLIYDGDILNVIGKKDCVINFRYLVIQDCEEPTPDNISRYLHIADKADIIKMLKSCNITVLGNIHENPELLK